MRKVCKIFTFYSLNSAYKGQPQIYNVTKTDTESIFNMAADAVFNFIRIFLVIPQAIQIFA